MQNQSLTDDQKKNSFSQSASNQSTRNTSLQSANPYPTAYSERIALFNPIDPHKKHI